MKYGIFNSVNVFDVLVLLKKREDKTEDLKSPQLKKLRPEGMRNSHTLIEFGDEKHISKFNTSKNEI
jgi:hypothetical protein